MLSLRRLLLAALAVTMVTAQCDEDVEIESDGDVSQLDSCSKLDGSIKLGKKVSAVSLPSSLNSITGDLVVDGAVGLTSFDAAGLRSIGGSFTLKGLTVLSSLTFPELVSVGDISWATLPALQQLSFAKGVSKATTVLITDTLLTSLEGINLETAERFNINNNRYLKSVDVQLSNVTDLLVIEANGKGVNASFPELKSAKNITIRDAGDVYFPKLSKVSSSAAFVNNTFTTLSFPELEEVGESFAVISSSKLTKITANNLESIGGTFQVANNTKLSTIDGFGALAVVGGAVDLSGVFTTVKLPSLDDVRGGFNLQSTEEVDCKPFDSLKGSVIKGDDYQCKPKSATAQSKTSGLGTAGSGSGDDDEEGAAGRFGISMAVAAFAGVAALFAL